MEAYATRQWREIKSYFDKTCLLLNEQADIVTGPLQIGFDITNQCMMRCLHCFNRSKSLKRDEMDDRQVLRVFDEIALTKPQQVCICGGEPLMRLELVLEGAKRIKDAGIFLGMVTNGYLLDRQVADRCSEVGFDQIQVSLDGFRDSHDRLRGVNGAFGRAFKAIECLVAAGVTVVTSFSPTKFNIEEFEAYIEFTKSIGVSEIRIQPLMMMGEAFIHNDIFPTDNQYHELVRVIKRANFDNLYGVGHDFMGTDSTHLSKLTGFNILWGDPVDHIIRFSQHLSKPTISYQIYSTGKIGVSPYFPITVGDINRHGLREYWEAGLNRIWETEIIQRSSNRIRGMQTLGNALPPVYFSSGVHVDIIDDSPEAIREKTHSFFELWPEGGASALHTGGT